MSPVLHSHPCVLLWLLPHWGICHSRICLVKWWLGSRLWKTLTIAVNQAWFLLLHCIFWGGRTSSVFHWNSVLHVKIISLSLINNKVADIFSSKGRQVWGESDLERSLKVRQNFLLKGTLRLSFTKIQYVVFNGSCSIWKPSDAKVLLCFLWSQFEIKLLTLLLSKSPDKKAHQKLIGFSPLLYIPLYRDTNTDQVSHPYETGWKTFKSSEQWFRGQFIRKVQCRCKRNYDELFKTVHTIVAPGMLESWIKMSLLCANKDERVYVKRVQDKKQQTQINRKAPNTVSAFSSSSTTTKNAKNKVNFGVLSHCFWIRELKELDFI